MQYSKAIFISFAICAIAILLAVYGPLGGGWAALVVVVVVAVMSGWVVLTQKTTKYTITSNRISEQFGIINTRKEQAPVKQITNISVDRNLFERMIGIARINIDTANDARDILQWHGVRNPEKIEALIDKAREDVGYGTGALPGEEGYEG